MGTIKAQADAQSQLPKKIRKFPNEILIMPWGFHILECHKGALLNNMKKNTLAFIYTRDNVNLALRKGRLSTQPWFPPPNARFRNFSGPQVSAEFGNLILDFDKNL